MVLHFFCRIIYFKLLTNNKLVVCLVAVVKSWCINLDHIGATDSKNAGNRFRNLKWMIMENGFKILHLFLINITWLDWLSWYSFRMSKISWIMKILNLAITFESILSKSAVSVSLTAEIMSDLNWFKTKSAKSSSDELNTDSFTMALKYNHSS